MRLVHAADIHLDSPLRGLTRLGDDAAAADLRMATRRALDNLVDLVIAEKADALLLAGDIYDGDWKDYATGRYFTEAMGRLHDHEVPVFMVCGNHDAESEITRSLRLPDNVRLLDTAQPETVPMDDLGLAVHGQGFATKAVMENLAQRYPDRIPGLVNVGLLHTSVAGSEGHEPYAPCSLSDLTAHGYEYFALGHIHKRQILTQGETTVAYSGNLQGRHPRETGPKGALVVDVEPGGVAEMTFHELDVARWEVLTVDVSDAESRDGALELVDQAFGDAALRAQGRLLVARVNLVGETESAPRLADAVYLREELDRAGSRLGVQVERVRTDVRAPQAQRSVDPAVFAAVESEIAALAGDPEGVLDLVNTLYNEVGRELREAELLALRDHDYLRELTTRASEDLQLRLLKGAS